MARSFHEYFGFTRNGINSQVLALPELDDPKEWKRKKRRNSFLRSAYFGRIVPSDARLLLNMNPSQILGVFAGFYLIGSEGRKDVWVEDPVQAYVRLFAEGRKSYGSELAAIDEVSDERRVGPFAGNGQSLINRLGIVVDRHPEIRDQFKMSDSLFKLFDERFADVYSPNMGVYKKNAEYRRRYVKMIIGCLKEKYEKFKQHPDFTFETLMANQATIIP